MKLGCGWCNLVHNPDDESKEDWKELVANDNHGAGDDKNKIIVLKRGHVGVQKIQTAVTEATVDDKSGPPAWVQIARLAIADGVADGRIVAIWNQDDYTESDPEDIVSR